MSAQSLVWKRPATKKIDSSPHRLFLVSAMSLLGFVLILSGPVKAQPAGDISGASDHPLLDRFPESSIVAYRPRASETYQLVLGSMRRVARQIVPEQFERIRADVTRITYEVSSAFDGASVYEYIQQQTQDKGYEPLFECRAQACGNSTYWANTAFSNRILSGPDRNQYYMVFDTSSATGGESYLSVYIITRGNRRLYAYFEIAETMAGDQSTTTYSAVTELVETGASVLNNISFDAQDRLVSDEGIDELVDYLRENLTSNVYVVGHLDEGAELEQLLSRSRFRAQQVVDNLVQKGIRAQRLSVQGVGPLAPSCALESDACLARVEVIVQR